MVPVQRSHRTQRYGTAATAMPTETAITNRRRDRTRSLLPERPPGSADWVLPSASPDAGVGSTVGTSVWVAKFAVRCSNELVMKVTSTTRAFAFSKPFLVGYSCP